MSELRVWWIPQIPGQPFYVPVKTLGEAALILDTLGRYDSFQLEHRIKPDYCNVGGLEEFDVEENDWLDWYDAESGENFEEWWSRNKGENKCL